MYSLTIWYCALASAGSSSEAKTAAKCMGVITNYGAEVGGESVTALAVR